MSTNRFLYTPGHSRTMSNRYRTAILFCHFSLQFHWHSSSNCLSTPLSASVGFCCMSVRVIVFLFIILFIIWNQFSHRRYSLLVASTVNAVCVLHSWCYTSHLHSCRQHCRRTRLLHHATWRMSLPPHPLCLRLLVHVCRNPHPLVSSGQSLPR